MKLLQSKILLGWPNLRAQQTTAKASWFYLNSSLSRRNSFTYASTLGSFCIHIKWHWQAFKLPNAYCCFSFIKEIVLTSSSFCSIFAIVKMGSPNIHLHSCAHRLLRSLYCPRNSGRCSHGHLCSTEEAQCIFNQENTCLPGKSH